ncbi:MAG: hypothetical protein NC186_05860 [Prevotella sp.]|nr:hypothetical protein [Prevotella sp.]
MKLNKLKNRVSQLLNDIAAVGKAILLSKFTEKPESPERNSIVILGNGPSLRHTIDNDSEWLRLHSLMAVNFAANTTDYFTLRPDFYILADPHFFVGYQRDDNVKKLWENLCATSWEMTLYIPVGQRCNLKKLTETGAFTLPANITVRRFNLTPADGSSGILHALFDRGLAMPRPRNVLIPAIMTAIRAGFKEIYLAGADHSWTKTLWVDEDNRVVSVQPHFYKDSDKELKRVRNDYEGLRICDVLGSMTTAFRSYHDIRSYADKRNIKIINATPGSFIDAFPRKI